MISHLKILRLWALPWMSISKEDDGIVHSSEEFHPLSLYCNNSCLYSLRDILYYFHGNLESQTFQVPLNNMKNSLRLNYLSLYVCPTTPMPQ